MKVKIINRVGDSSVFETMELAKPKIIPGHVLIEVMATSVNPIDCKIRSGMFPMQHLPAILHGDVAGIVVEVADDVTQFKVGDQVYGCPGGVAGVPGALAEFMLADAKMIAHKPKSLSFAEAAALPLVTLTAWEAVIDRLKITAGQKILVHAATGGVGHIAVQLARLAGAVVYTTVSSVDKASIAKQLGADYVINYRELSVDGYVQQYTNGKGFDTVFDTVGGDNLEKSLLAAAINGQVASIMLRAEHDLTLMHMKNLTLHAIFMVVPLIHNQRREYQSYILQRVAELIDLGRLKPLIDSRRFNFEQIGAAHDYFESGKAIGKVVVAKS